MKFSNDKTIVTALINRDEIALKRFYQAYHRILFQFIHHQIDDVHLCEELAQDTLIDFFESLRDFRFQCSLKTYLFTIAQHKTIDLIRKKKIKKILFSALPIHIVEGLKTIFIDDEVERRELEEQINKVFSRLPNDYQVVLRLKYIEGDKVQTIAQKLALKFKATESLIFRARKAFIKTFKAI